MLRISRLLLGCSAVLLIGCGTSNSDANTNADACVPTTCAAQGAECGEIDDGCGDLLSCGDSCVAPNTCGGGGIANVCGDGCAPTTCAAQGAECGEIDDGCGDLLSCGDSCVAPDTCGGGGTANVCGSGGIFSIDFEDQSYAPMSFDDVHVETVPSVVASTHPEGGDYMLQTVTSSGNYFGGAVRLPVGIDGFWLQFDFKFGDDWLYANVNQTVKQIIYEVAVLPPSGRVFFNHFGYSPTEAVLRWVNYDDDAENTYYAGQDYVMSAGSYPWTRVKLYRLAESAEDADDGVIEVYLDDVLTYSNYAASTGINDVQEIWFGYRNDPFASTMTVFYDNIICSFNEP